SLTAMCCGKAATTCLPNIHHKALSTRDTRLLGFFDFRIQLAEELRSQHLGLRCDHPLAHSGDYSSDLQIAFVSNRGSTVGLLQIEIARAFCKTGPAFPVDNHSIVRRRLHVFETHVALEDSFHWADAGFHRRDVSIISRLIQRLATRDASLQDLRFGERCVNPIARSVNLVSTFDLHRTKQLENAE